MARKRPRTLLIPKDQIDALVRDFGKDFNPANARLFFAIRSLAQRINDRANEWLAPLETTATKFNYLAVLYAKRATGLTLNDLSTFVHTSNATVTSMIDSLEREVLVTRSQNPDDRRSTMVRLTPKGTNLIKKAFVKHHAGIDASLKAFTAQERRLLLDLLVRLGESLEE